MRGSHVGLRNVPDGFAVSETYTAVVAAIVPPPHKAPGTHLLELTLEDGRKLAIAADAIAYVIEQRR